MLFTNSMMHPCGPELNAGAGGALRPASGGRGGLAGGRGRWGQRLTLSSQRNSHWGRSTQTLEEPPAEKPLEGRLWPQGSSGCRPPCLPMLAAKAQEKQSLSVAGSNSPVNGASLRRARSAEAESPPATQLYALRSRAAAPPHRSPPGFGHSPDPEAAAAADHAASTTMGPIKSRLKVPYCVILGRTSSLSLYGGGTRANGIHLASMKCCYLPAACSVSHRYKGV